VRSKGEGKTSTKEAENPFEKVTEKKRPKAPPGHFYHLKKIIARKGGLPNEGKAGTPGTLNFDRFVPSKKTTGKQKVFP